MNRPIPVKGQRLSKMIVPEIKVISAKDGRIQATVSSETEDRDGDVISQKGWILDYFDKHPVLVSSHDYTKLTNQIGEWEDMSVKNKNLTGVARYYRGMGNFEADWGYMLAERGRAAFSVGFIPWEMEERDVKDMTRPPSWVGGYKYTKQELLEVSQVVVPAHPEALQLIASGKGFVPEIKQIAKGILGDKVLQDFYSEKNAKEVLSKMEKKGMELCNCYAPECGNMAAVYIPLCPEHLMEALCMLAADEDAEEGAEMSMPMMAARTVAAYRVRSEGSEKDKTEVVVEQKDTDTGCTCGCNKNLSAEKTLEEGDLSSGGALVEEVSEIGKSVSGATNLPLADRERAWDGDGAKARVAKWASSDGSGDKEKISWSKYAKAFFSKDGDGEKLGDYKLPFADVIDGELKAVPRGVFAAAAVMQGARGGADVGDADAIKSRIAGYYSKMRDEFDDDSIVAPWDKKDIEDVTTKSEDTEEVVDEVVEKDVEDEIVEKESDDIVDKESDETMEKSVEDGDEDIDAEAVLKAAIALMKAG